MPTRRSFCRIDSDNHAGPFAGVEPPAITVSGRIERQRRQEQPRLD